MEKTSAPGTTVWLHLRPAAGDLIWGSDPNFVQGPLPAGSVTERKDRSTIPSDCSGRKPRQFAMWLKTWPTDTYAIIGPGQGQPAEQRGRVKCQELLPCPGHT